MTDYLELDSLFQKTNMVAEPSYEKVEYIQLADEQGGVYDSGEISYSTTMTEKSNVELADSILALPLRVNLADDKKIAIKNSLLSLIQGVDIRSSAGTNIANDTTGSTAALANLKLLIDSSTDFHDGNELMFFGKDQHIDPDVMRGVAGADAAKRSRVGHVSSSVTAALPENDPRHNPALASRISVFASRSNAFVASGGGSLGYREFIAMIPLKFIHDFFAQMHFPLPNLGLRITFRIAGVGGNTAYFPFTCPSSSAHLTLGAPDAAAVLAPLAAGAAPTKAEFDAAMDATLAPAVTALAKPTIEIRPTVTDRAGWSTKPSLYIKTVYFRSEEATQLAKAITEGFEKKIVYTVSQAYPFLQSSAQVSQIVTTGVIRPTRLWVMPLPAPAQVGGAGPVVNYLASENNSFPAAIGPNILTNFNIMLNGNPFYNNELRSQYQFYREFRTQLIAAGSSLTCGTPISYEDWLQGVNPYVFDLSRNPTVKSNNSSELTVVCAVKDRAGADVAASTLYCIVERLRTCVLHVSAGGITMATKDGAEL